VWRADTARRYARVKVCSEQGVPSGVLSRRETITRAPARRRGLTLFDHGRGETTGRGDRSPPACHVFQRTRYAAALAHAGAQQNTRSRRVTGRVDSTRSAPALQWLPRAAAFLPTLRAVAWPRLLGTALGRPFLAPPSLLHPSWAAFFGRALFTTPFLLRPSWRAFFAPPRFAPPAFAPSRSLLRRSIVGTSV